MVERDNKKPYQKILNFLSIPVSIAIAVFVVVTIIVIGISLKYYESGFGRDVLVEAHGMLFDILIIGILILFLNKLAEKRIANQRYIDEIDDFRGWRSDEAAHRIAGNIKRLNRNGFKEKIYLNDCFLSNIDLLGINLQKADLCFADLQYANLEYALLQDADLCFANLEKASLKRANLQNANLVNANIMYANLEEVNLRGANLHDSIGLTIKQLSEVKTLYKAKLDDELMQQVKEKYPHLLEVSKPDE